MKKQFIFPILLTIIISSCSLVQEEYSTYILSYGVGTYIEGTTGRPNLSYTVKDASEVYDLFTSKGYQGYLRTDSTATKEQLTEDIQELSLTIRPKDVIVLYFSGHAGQYGISDAGNEPFERDIYTERLLLYGSVYDSEGSIKVDEELMISDDELNVLLACINTKKKVIIIDACNSGGFIGTSSSLDAVPQNYKEGTIGITGNSLSKAVYLYFAYPNLPDTDINQDNAFIITASGEREYSYEEAGLQNGVFTHFFLESPTLADRDKNGSVTVTEAYSHTFRRIMEEWNNPNHPVYRFLPHVSSGAMDLHLFAAD